MKTYSRGGLTLQYPANWTLEEDAEGPTRTVTLQSSGTAFLMAQHDATMPTLEQMADTALKALRDDYPDLDAEERIESVAGQPAFGHDVSFFSLDLVCNCWIRSFFTHEGTVLFLWQVTDHELEQYEPVIRAMLASIQLTEDATVDES